MLQNCSKIIIYYVINNFKNIVKYRRCKYIYIGEKEKLDPKIIPKYKNQLYKPHIFHPILIKTRKNDYKEARVEEYLYFIDICSFKEQILPHGFPKTTVIGAAGLIKTSKGTVRYIRAFPGASFEVSRYAPIHVRWRNKTDRLIRIYIHGLKSYKTDISYELDKLYKRVSDHKYENNQETALYWYQDKSNLMSTIGLYIIKEDKKDYRYNFKSMDLPVSKYKYPLIIQDCSFYKDGSVVYPSGKVSDKSNTAVSWLPYYGDVILVNGRAWPNLEVERRQYRFYILNASRSRFYNLYLSNGVDFLVIGGDKGLLPSAVRQKNILLAPGERVDLLIDFSRLAKGSRIILRNDAKTPYPHGELVNPETVGQIMSFHIPDHEALSISPSKLPNKLYDAAIIPKNLPVIVNLISKDVEVKEGSVLLNGNRCTLPITIKGQIESPQEWCFINITELSYPVYFKESKFRIISRQEIDTRSFSRQWNDSKDYQTIGPHLLGDPKESEEYERGWKDTLRIDPGMVTWVLVQSN